LNLITLDNYTVPETMNAVVLEGPKKLKYTKIPVWPIEKYNNKEDFLLVKVESCGVCGSDFRYFEGENPWAQHTLGYHVNNQANIVLGHEFSGKIVAADKKNIDWLGKRVAPICSRVCGECHYCKTGRENICPNTIHLGHGQGWGNQLYFPGAYAEYVPVWGQSSFEITDNVTYEDAAMMDILAVCNHVYKQGNTNPNKLPILIIGAGPAGNGIAQIAKIKGIQDIIIIEKSLTAITIAKQAGFKYIINPENKSLDKLKDKILHLTNNHGVISVYDSVGNDFSFSLGINVLDKGGTFVNMAVHNKEISFNNMLLSGERKITTSSNFSLDDYKEALSWLNEGKFNLKPWYTQVKLKDIPEIFENSLDKEKDFFKLIIK